MTRLGATGKDRNAANDGGSFVFHSRLRGVWWRWMSLKNELVHVAQGQVLEGKKIKFL